MIGGATVIDHFACSFNDGDDTAVCTNVVVAASGSDSTTISATQTGQVLKLSVPVSTATDVSTNAAGRITHIPQSIWGCSMILIVLSVSYATQ